MIFEFCFHLESASFKQNSGNLQFSSDFIDIVVVICLLVCGSLLNVGIINKKTN